MSDFHFHALPRDHDGQVWRVRTEHGTAAFFDWTGPASLCRREPMRRASGRINTLGEPPLWSVLGYGPWAIVDGRTVDEPPSLGVAMIYGRTPREAIRSSRVVDIRPAGPDAPPCDLPTIEDRGEYDPADPMSGWLVWGGAELRGLRANGPTRQAAIIRFAADLDAYLDGLARGYPDSRVRRWWASRAGRDGSVAEYLVALGEVETND
ncbi:hypothetical protein [Nocardioides sp. KR10-350]|uniref:hypothetical protein n=1 Tax=Nocardioides cheoyonin TaxID=3156615 RepID=UPI0032B5D29B